MRILLFMNATQIIHFSVLAYSLYQWFPKLFSENQFWLFFVIPIIVSLPSISSAQSLGTLPPPPPLRVPENALPHISNEPAPKFSSFIPTTVTPAKLIPPDSVLEYTFQSPTSPRSSFSITPRGSVLPFQYNKTSSLYRVEVIGKNISVLSQVKTVEPLAFIRQNEGVIHAGIFKQSQQAQKRVVELQRKGLSASVVQVYKSQEGPN